MFHPPAEGPVHFGSRNNSLAGDVKLCWRRAGDSGPFEGQSATDVGDGGGLSQGQSGGEVGAVAGMHDREGQGAQMIDRGREAGGRGVQEMETADDVDDRASRMKLAGVVDEVADA